ncbi:MAG: M3 family oligoendopeptidase [Bacteroidota bacterium]|nr:M3 family oligoendopeptidase [Bacteroidota bacterium]
MIHAEEIQSVPRNFMPEVFTLEAWDGLKPFVEDLEQRAVESEQDFRQWLADRNEVTVVFEEIARWKYIHTSLDTKDEVAKKEREFIIAEIRPKWAQCSHTLNQKFNELQGRFPLNDEACNNYIHSVSTDIKMFRDENVSLGTQIQLKAREYDAISGNWSVDIDGETKTLQQAKSYLESDDRSIREKVWRSIANARYQDNQTLDKLYSELADMRQKVARNAGFENFRDYKHKAMHRTSWPVQACYDYADAVEKHVMPIVNAIQAQRKQDLGYGALRPWDTEIDSGGNPPLKPFSTTAEFVERGVASLKDVDPFFGECISKMDAMGRLDLESRLGKAPGGYNMPLPETGIPFVFMNHACLEYDVRVLVHEAGHAVHSFLSHELSHDWMKDTPSEVAELASMSMELFTMEHWEHFYPNPDDLKRAKRNHLEGLLTTLPAVARIDSFQHWIYTNPGHSVQERHAAWLDLTSRFTSHVFDTSGLEKFDAVNYQRVLHIYHIPFYYIEYGLAQLGAIAMWRNYCQDPKKTIEQYKNALALGYTKDVPSIYQAAGIQFDFSDRYVKELASFVYDQWKRLV